MGLCLLHNSCIFYLKLFLEPNIFLLGVHSFMVSTVSRQGLGGRGRVGRGLELREELCIPLPAALVELSALDQANTPLDR